MKSITLYLFFAACLLTSSVHAQDVYMKFVQYASGGGSGGSNGGSDGTIATAGLGPGGTARDGGTTIQLIDYLQVASFQFDQEQTLNIGSQSSGAGAGKITFNPMTITKPVDAFSPKLFQAMASGTPYRRVEIVFIKSGGANNSTVYYKIILKLVAVKTMAESTVVDCTNGCAAESDSFEYGGMQVLFYKQQPDGSYNPTPIKGGWDRILNVADLN